MNKRAFVFFSLIASLLLLLATGIVGHVSMSRMEEHQERIYFQNLRNELNLVVKTVRNDLVFGNIRVVRGHLNSLMDSGAYSGFAIFRDSEQVASSDGFESEKFPILIEVPVFFDESSVRWGKVLFALERTYLNTAKRAYRFVQWGSASLFALSSLLLLIIFFVTISRATARLIPIVESLALNEALNEPSRFESMVWGPMLIQFRALAKTLRDRREELDAARAQSRIAHVVQNIAHDMRGPLASFETVTRCKSWEEFQSARPLLESSLRRVHTMVEAFRNQDAELVVQPRWVKGNFGEVIDCFKRKAEDVGIALSVSLEEIPQIYVDFPKLERALANLVSNALEVRASTVMVKVATAQGNLAISVWDNGTGVPEQFVPNLFTRGKTYGKEGGTGLGLAYTQGVSRGHGGVTTYRREGGWTVFEITIPNAARPPTSSNESPENLEPAVPTQVREMVVFQIENATRREEFKKKASELGIDWVSFAGNDVGKAAILYTDNPQSLGESSVGNLQVVLASPADRPDEVLKRLQRRFQMLSTKLNSRGGNEQA